MIDETKQLPAPAGLTGAERAALVLRELGEMTAAAVLREMDEVSINRISTAMSNLKGVTPQIREDIMLSFAADLGITGLGEDGMKFLNRVLVKALGEQNAKDILDRLRRHDRRSNFHLPPNTDARTLAMQMMNERPQTIAVLLAHIPHELGANLLTYLPEPLAAEALYRFSTLDVVSPGVVKELRDMLEELAMQTGPGGRRLGDLGGAKQTADIINHFPSAMSETILGAINERDAQTAEKIRENLFTFIDLGKLPDRSLQILLSEAPAHKLAPALRLVDEELRQRFFQNLSARQAEVLKEELSSGPPIRRANALAAQSEIVDTALRLAAEGRISINATEEMV
ncbi:flagellar motor switch protein FliG [Acidocella sp.]|uniref:flagellar motor switch protein FliG n=1 Tax=Acidocella sp. TaxID=50710 RepID=UPI002611B90B|nr:FliG C-terminal domain-containing protein [Acidocella sp.]